MRAMLLDLKDDFIGDENSDESDLDDEDGDRGSELDAPTSVEKVTLSYSDSFSMRNIPWSQITVNFVNISVR